MAHCARTRRALPFLVAALVTICLVPRATAQGDGWRTIEIETTEVTAPDVALSPDGEWLIFTMLGKLFRLPVEGGDAEQLTFGPYYDTDLAISPDGNRVAFVSDRDGSEGNIFVFELATGEITQVTHESWAGGPTWTPDSQALVYLRLVREAWRWGRRWGVRAPPPTQVRRVALDGGEPETLRAALADVRSAFHLPDGRVGWAIVEPDTTVPLATPLIAPGTTTRIEVMAGDGTLSTLRTLDGIVERIVSSPTGDGLYIRGWFLRAAALSGFQHTVAFVPLPDGLERPIVAVSAIDRYDFFGGQPRFAVATEHAALYVGHLGRLWKVGLPGGERYPIAFRAQIALEVRALVPPPTWTIPAPGETATPQSIRFPRLSPDGQRMVFAAARYLWEQPLDGGPVRRLSDTGSIDWQPTFSPDGRKVAFLHESIATDRELRVFDVATGETRTVSTGVRDRSPNWTPNGERLIVVDDPDNRSFRLVAIDVADATRDILAEIEGDFLGSDGDLPVSPDGQWLYFVARRVPGHPSIPTVFRLSLRDPTASPEPITQLALQYRRGRVSPDGRWFVFQHARRLEIRVVPLGGERVSVDDSRVLPDHLTFEEAAALPIAAVTAWNALFTYGQLRPGDFVLLEGTGGVSIFGLLFSVAAGARPIITSSSDAKLERARELGAFGTVNYRTNPDWQNEVRALTGNVGVAHVLEVGGRETLPRAVRALGYGGHIALIGGLSGRRARSMPLSVFERGGSVTFVGPGSRADFEAMNEFISEHQLRPVIDRVFSFEEAPAAYEYMASGRHFAKIVIKL